MSEGMTETLNHAIEYAVTDSICTITLNRPDQLNSFDKQMHQEMAQALARVAQDENVRVLVISANGRGFCAGQDLADADVQPGGNIGHLIETYYNPMIVAITELPIPVIAKVQGVAAGAGANLALACDMVFASDKASFIQAFSGIGLIPDCGGTWQLPKLIGLARAKGLALTGERLSAADAAAMGMIWKCVPHEDLDEVVNDLATKFSQSATRGLAQTKLAMHAACTTSLSDQLAREARVQAELGASQDYAEGVDAFSNKRTPIFVGK